MTRPIEQEGAGSGAGTPVDPAPPDIRVLVAVGPGEEDEAREAYEGLIAHVVCDAYISDCRCNLETGHGGPHECNCEGSWAGSDGEPGGVTAIYSLPNLALGPMGPAL